MKLDLAEDDRPPAKLSLEEYLHSSFRPDCDFVDGRSEERNVGIFNHSALVGAIMVAMHRRRDEWNAQVLPSLRMRVSPTRVRIPDLCLISRNAPKEQVLTHPPLVAIEVLDEDDCFCATMEKLADFERFGVQRIWIIDPDSRIAFRYINTSLEEVSTGDTDPFGAQRNVRRVGSGLGVPLRLVFSQLL
jgi:Uma2 family endonuclease